MPKPNEPHSTSSDDSVGSDLYPSLYNSIYNAGYHCDPHFTHARQIIEFMLPRRLSSSASVLDIGAGAGKAVELLRSKGYSSIGVEIALKGVIDAALMGRHVVLGNACDLPFGREMFDCVMSTDVMEHIAIDHVQAAIGEQLRVVKSGGLIVAKIASFQTGGGEKQYLKHAKILDQFKDGIHLTVKPHEWWVNAYEKAAEGIARVTVVEQDWGERSDTLAVVVHEKIGTV